MAQFIFTAGFMLVAGAAATSIVRDLLRLA